ncbi:MFS transporter [Nocardioides halotolerans]|uniref:MFS transporter n=1 Tax=Nocardioides halotolerans TaxID=433660 RepID=UPI00040B40CE|nr:MFS transporter [Nocardioides halotolerans]
MTSSLAQPWRLLRRRPDLARLVTAGLVSLTGDWLLGVGLSYAVYDLTGSTMASAGVLLTALLPQVLVGLVAGVLVDRWDRRRTMIGANLLLAAGLLPLLLVDDAGLIWVVYPVLVLEAVVETFFAPAEQSMLPRVVDETESAELVTANALNGQAHNLSRLLGGAAGGVLAALGGIPLVAFADIATFLLAALLVSRIRTSGAVAPREQSAEDAVRGRFAELRDEWVEGARITLGSRTVRVLATFWLITSFGEGIWGTLFAPYVRSVLHGGPEALGLISGIQAVGGVVGGLFAAAYGARWRPERMLAVGAMLFGVVDLAIALYPLGYVHAWPAAVLMVVVGLPGAVLSAGLMTLFQLNTDDRERGRAFALLLLVRSTFQVLGSLTAGVLGGILGIVPVMAWQGCGYVIAGSIVLVLLVRAPEPAPASS